MFRLTTRYTVNISLTKGLRFFAISFWKLFKKFRWFRGSRASKKISRPPCGVCAVCWYHTWVAVITGFRHAKKNASCQDGKEVRWISEYLWLFCADIFLNSNMCLAFACSNSWISHKALVSFKDRALSTKTLGTSWIPRTKHSDYHFGIPQICRSNS